jgi:hypothetical protein
VGDRSTAVKPGVTSSTGLSCGAHPKKGGKQWKEKF